MAGIDSKTCSVDRKSHSAYVRKKSRPKIRFQKIVRGFFRNKKLNKKYFSREKKSEKVLQKSHFFQWKINEQKWYFFFEKCLFLIIFDFHIFSKIKFSSKKSVFENVFGFYFYIISRAQPTQVASRNSPCAAHKGVCIKFCVLRRNIPWHLPNRGDTLYIQPTLYISGFSIKSAIKLCFRQIP